MAELYKTISEDWVCKGKEELGIDRKSQGKLSEMGIAMEDNISTKGILTRAGSKMLENYIPPFNASIIDNLLLEDAEIKGKFQAREFGVGGYIDNSMASLVKSRRVAASIGVDTCGEIGRLSSEYDLYGFKPSYGSISRYGLISSMPSFETVGVLSNSIDTISILFDVMSKRNKQDSTSVDFKEEERDIKKIEEVKIAILEEDVEVLNSTEKSSLEKLIEEFKKEFSFKYLELPSIKYCQSIFNILGSGELASNMGRFDGLFYGHQVENYKGLEDYIKKNRTEGFSDGLKKKIMFGNFVLNDRNYEKYYGKSQRVRALIKHEFQAGIEELDIIVRPIRKDSERQGLLSNIVGCPSMNLPVNEDGIGIQIIAGMYKEKLLFDFARYYERNILKEAVRHG